MSVPDELKERKGKAFFFRFKVFLRNAYLPMVVIFVGVTSFSIGRLSAIPFSGVSIQNALVVGTEEVGVQEKMEQIVPVVQTEKNTSESVVASKNGSVYYLPWCSQVDRIKSENLVTFSSREEAIARGYKPSTACKGTY